MTKTFLPVSRPSVDKDDISFITKECLQKNFVGPSEIIKNFEKIISKDLSKKYGLATNSGTSALITAVASLNLPKKSKILIPNSTIVSVLNSVLINNHIPIFCDINNDDWNITFLEVKSICKIHNISACIIVENLNSSSKELDLIIKFLKKSKIKIIEDASESFGGSFKNIKFGSMGDITTLSFYPNKLITTGEGGMLLTDNKNYFEFSKKYINLFFGQSRNFKHYNVGYNFRINSISAALGLSQYRKKDKFLLHRKKIYKKYLDELNWKYLRTQKIYSFIDSSYWVFPLTINYKNFKAIDIIEYLDNHNIQSRHLFYPLSQQPLLNKKQKMNNSLNLYMYGFYIPLGNGITIPEVGRTIKTLNNFFNDY